MKLTDQQKEELAELAAEKALEKIYIQVGKSVLKRAFKIIALWIRFFIILGVLVFVGLLTSGGI
ncbi:MAG: hypothetical protein MJA29_04370 [Candidatus Omnitrophica bacterium]|nr:hypothetical protein [Candidatus Omnitrophota bacterium]